MSCMLVVATALQPLSKLPHEILTATDLVANRGTLIPETCAALEDLRGPRAALDMAVEPDGRAEV